MIRVEMAPTARNPGELMDWLLQTDARLQSLGKTLHLRQERLKKAVSAAQYARYLLIEEAANELCVRLVSAVWAITRSRAGCQACCSRSLSGSRAERCSYRVKWSEEDELFEASCEEFPSLRWREADRAHALAGIVRLVGQVESVPSEG